MTSLLFWGLTHLGDIDVIFSCKLLTSFHLLLTGASKADAAAAPKADAVAEPKPDPSVCPVPSLHEGTVCSTVCPNGQWETLFEDQWSSYQNLQWFWYEAKAQTKCVTGCQTLISVCVGACKNSDCFCCCVKGFPLVIVHYTQLCQGF